MLVLDIARVIHLIGIFESGAAMRHLLFLSCFILAALPVQAEESPKKVAPKLAVELNGAETRENSCTLTFVITNGLGQDIDQAVYETVLFDLDGKVNRLTLFDFGALPQDRPRVRQFAVPDTTCEDLGRILFNGGKTCTGGTLTTSDCETGLVPTSRTKIEVLG